MYCQNNLERDSKALPGGLFKRRKTKRAPKNKDTDKISAQVNGLEEKDRL